MVAAYHLIWTAYACRLPNDPRGSCSRELRVDRLAPLGEMHYERKPVQPPSSTLRRFYRAADELLEHNRMLCDDTDVALIAASFAKTIAERSYVCHACAIMPDHVHLVVRRHPDQAEGILRFLQDYSKQALIAAGRRPVNHPVWGGPGWRVFLNSPEEIAAKIEYVRQNPLKAGLPEQLWDFVIPYDGWMPSFFDL